MCHRFPYLGFGHTALRLAFSMGFFDFRFLCLHGNHFTYTSVFPAPELPCFIPFIFVDLIPPII